VPSLLVWALACGCDKVPLLAPAGSTITLSAPTRALPVGGSTEITAVVVESSGTPVQNGTTVRFTATLGTLNPAEAQTRNGVAVTTFIAGETSGVAEIRATSGAAGVAPPVGTGTGTTNTQTQSNVLQITIGAANAARVALMAAPTTLPSTGGSSRITATVLDGAGSPIRGARVVFSASAGTLSASSATTDASGDATVTLTTTRNATVTARVGSGAEGLTATIDVTVGVPAAVTLTCLGSGTTAGSSCSQQVGLSVSFTARRETTAGAAPIVSSTLEFGDGTSMPLGTLSSSTTVSHVYQNTGSYVATLRATDANGETTAASVSVSIVPRTPINVTVSASTPTTRCTAITFTAEVSPAGESISSFRWQIDSNTDSEDETVTTSGRTLTRVFPTTGIKRLEVTATATDGRSGTAQTQINVTEPATPTSC
ncbi:MAG TPA: Ig-like domain-containing protein, partial [Vicinamibacterales bacterium]|nr:Ig-like domain-containing protein [Vicinamibacterales bacterium]